MRNKHKHEHEQVEKTLTTHERRLEEMEVRLLRLEREKGIFKPPPSQKPEAA